MQKNFYISRITSIALLKELVSGPELLQCTIIVSDKALIVQITSIAQLNLIARIYNSGMLI